MGQLARFEKSSQLVSQTAILLPQWHFKEIPLIALYQGQRHQGLSDPQDLVSQEAKQIAYHPAKQIAFSPARQALLSLLPPLLLLHQAPLL